MAELARGEIHYIHFPYTLDPRYPTGKKKFVLVLQEGEYFKKYDTVVVLLLTSEEESKGFETNVTVELGTTDLDQESYIIGAQPYPVKKSLFSASGAWCAGKLDDPIMDQVDEALYIGLCMGKQNEE
ncbi:type II toxin-antitoxin system PemK/MazF family toxin [Priestia megaterium]|uniref:type II toxin-antitoxin system PemK/MazF family toxin n=1 Tax=Priestia megaterium TaxID=1404 RepID=UPI00316B3C87